VPGADDDPDARHDRDGDQDAQDDASVHPRVSRQGTIEIVPSRSSVA
jgi:hypothetical protein